MLIQYEDIDADKIYLQLKLGILWIFQKRPFYSAAPYTFECCIGLWDPGGTVN